MPRYQFDIDIREAPLGFLSDMRNDPNILRVENADSPRSPYHNTITVDTREPIRTDFDLLRYTQGPAVPAAPAQGDLQRQVEELRRMVDMGVLTEGAIQRLHQRGGILREVLQRVENNDGTLTLEHSDFDLLRSALRGVDLQHPDYGINLEAFRRIALPLTKSIYSESLKVEHPEDESLCPEWAKSGSYIRNVYDKSGTVYRIVDVQKDRTLTRLVVGNGEEVSDHTIWGHSWGRWEPVDFNPAPTCWDRLGQDSDGD